MNTTILPKKKISLYSKYEKKSFLFCYLMVLFPVVQFAVFWVGVNTSSIMLAFQDGAGAFTFDNIGAVFRAFSATGVDKYGNNLGNSMGHSLVIWLVSNGITFPISIVTTYVLFQRIHGHYFFRVCYVIPNLMGSIMFVSLIQYMVNFDGAITWFVKLIGVELPEEALRNGLFGSAETAFPTLIVINLVMGLVGNNAVLTGAFSRLPEELYESAELDGAGFWTVCFKIAIPCVWTTISMSLTFALCGVLTADANVFLYSGGTGEPNMSTIGFVLYNITYQISLTGGSPSAYGYPSALGFVLTIFTLPIVFGGRWILGKIQDAVEV
ncbi:MAG: sugar ABC transporter permease [Clostridia bacterium]|nr:sugar ABC transporter permease [Clostridia bacterium]